MKITKTVKDFFAGKERKKTTLKQRRENPTNIDTGIDTIKNAKRQRIKQMKAFQKELGNS